MAAPWYRGAATVLVPCAVSPTAWRGTAFQRNHRDPGAHPNGAVLRSAQPVRDAIMPVSSMRMTAASA
jgi:hypothetical protein